MQNGSGSKPLSFTVIVLSGMFILAAIFGTGRGAEVYEGATRTVPIEPPARPLGVPDTSYDETLTAQEWTAWAALFGAFISLGALGVLFQTLNNTKELLIAAQTTNQIAEKNLSVSVTSAEAQVRAYLCFEKPVLLINNQGSGFRITVSNMGQSPAFRFGLKELKISIVSPTGQTESFRSAHNPPNILVSTAFQIFRNQPERFDFPAEFTPVELARIVSLLPGSTFIFDVRGIFYYEDIFDKAIEESFLASGKLTGGAQTLDTFAIIGRSVAMAPRRSIK